ncbi:MAG: hypothetical protein K2J31_03820 [Alistipes sp.]|nr:hypothetical protein [Alistipes sp.]
MKNRCRNIVTLLITTLFIGYWCSTTMFMHVHYIDGVRIVHSHPYTGSASSHGHSSNQLQAISYLSAFAAIVTLAGLTTSILTWLRLHRTQHDEQRASAVMSSYCSLRAPPVCL